MAHKTVEAAIASIKRDQDPHLKEYGTDVSRGIIIVWRKDYERWPTELVAAATENPRYTACKPEFLTKNQVVIAEDKIKTAASRAIAEAYERNR